MLQETITIKDWEQFVRVAAKASIKGPEGANTFRGQSDSSWGLEPSLLRLLREMNVDNSSHALEIESKGVAEFRKLAHLHSEHCAQHSPHDLLFWWEMMQHYQAPTRLLDWTQSPYVALYFAVTEHPKVDGAIFCMDAARLGWIQSTRRGRPGFENFDALKHLQSALVGEEYEVSMGLISCPKPTDRMIAQQSEFTYSTELLEPHDRTADTIVYGGVHGGEGHTIFRKYVIPAELKLEMQARLFAMNMTASSLFPGLDGLGRSVQDRLRLTMWWANQ